MSKPYQCSLCIFKEIKPISFFSQRNVLDSNSTALQMFSRNTIFMRVFPYLESKKVNSLSQNSWNLTSGPLYVYLFGHSSQAKPTKFFRKCLKKTTMMFHHDKNSAQRCDLMSKPQAISFLYARVAYSTLLQGH